MVRASSIILVAVLIAALAATALGEVGDGACIDYNKAKESNCGVTVDSDAGHGAVDLCGDCFACGFLDDVCPEDFGANCSACADPDCIITVTGYVLSPDPQNLPLPGADVIADLDHLETYTTSTADDGYFSMQIPAGKYELRVRHDDYPYQVVPLPEERGVVDLGYIHMPNPGCNDDCTTWTEVGDRCQTLCRNVNNCDPKKEPYDDDTSKSITTDLLEKCEEEGAAPGTSVFLGAIDDEHQLWGTCCSGPVYSTNWRRATDPVTEAKDLTQKILPATYKGPTQTIRGVRLKILIYNK